MWKKLVNQDEQADADQQARDQIGKVIAIVMPLRNGSRERTSGNARGGADDRRDQRHLERDLDASSSRASLIW